MISKDRTERDGLASCEAPLGHMIGGTEENHAVIQLMQALNGPKFETRPTQIYHVSSAWLLATYG